VLLAYGHHNQAVGYCQVLGLIDTINHLLDGSHRSPVSVLLTFVYLTCVQYVHCRLFHVYLFCPLWL
jgi:hypothetical protein